MSSGPTGSNSKCKYVKFNYNDTLNDLRMTPEDNIFGINADKLKALLAKNLLFEAVGSVTERLPTRCNWSDVASSSDDSSDENESRFLGNKSSSPSIQLGKTDGQPVGSDHSSKSTLDKKENRNDSKQPDNSEIKSSAPDILSNLNEKYTRSNNLNDLNNLKPVVSKTISSDFSKSADSETIHAKGNDSTHRELASKYQKNFPTGEDIKRTKNNEKHKFEYKIQNSSLSKNYKRQNIFKGGRFEKKSKDLSESADLEVVCERLSDKLTLDNQSSEVKERNGQKYKKYFHKPNSLTFEEQSKDNSINLSDSITFKIAHKRQNKFKSKVNGNDDHYRKLTCKKENNDQKWRKENTKGRKFQEKASGFSHQNSKETNNGSQFSTLMNAMLKKRVSHRETNRNNQEIALYCKFCQNSEHSPFESLNHFNSSHHKMKCKIYTITNYYCSICKLIICCEKEDSLKEDHLISFPHKLMGKNFTKELSVHEECDVDSKIIQKFNCILLKSQPVVNVKSSLVPYDSTEESSSDEDQIYGEQLRDSPRQHSGTVFGNPLASVFVFPLKMEPAVKDDQHWVKFIDIAGGPEFHQLSKTLDVLKDYGDVNQCLVDMPSRAVYVPFKKWGDVQKVYKSGNNFMNEHKLQPVTIDLLGRAPGKGGNDCSALLGNKHKFMELINLSVNAITRELDSFEAKTKLIKLKTSIAMAIEHEYPECVVFEFGSRVSGLSSSNSDFDLFVDLTGQMYWGTSGAVDEAQFKIETIQHIEKIQRILRKKRDEFTDVLGILTARVPILRCTHIPTDSHCDLSFRNGLCVENTKLISKYLRMNVRIRWVIMAVKYWAQVCGMASAQNFTTYSLTWMVLFYLMTKNLVPSVSSLMDLKKKDQLSIQGWKYETTDEIGVVEILESEDKLLQGFFGYYAHFNFTDTVICPRIGSVVQKNIIDKCLKNKMPDELKDYVNYIQQFSSPETNAFDVTVCCVQDPFLLSHNITRQVRPPILKSFRKYCDIANIEMLLWNK